MEQLFVNKGTKLLYLFQISLFIGVILLNALIFYLLKEAQVETLLQRLLLIHATKNPFSVTLLLQEEVCSRGIYSPCSKDEDTLCLDSSLNATLNCWMKENPELAGR